MLSRILLGLLLCVPVSFFAQSSSFQSYCNDAYAANPEVPKGLLEAVSFVQTRMTHLDASVQESCTGMPRAWGYMGLIADGEGYFNNTLSLVSAKSGIPVSTILAEPAMEIKAYAAAYTAIINEYEGIVYSKISPLFIKSFLLKLSFIPDSGAVNDFAQKQ